MAEKPKSTAAQPAGKPRAVKRKSYSPFVARKSAVRSYFKKAVSR